MRLVFGSRPVYIFPDTAVEFDAWPTSNQSLGKTDVHPGAQKIG
jgi:hypothetical protein